MRNPYRGGDEPRANLLSWVAAALASLSLVSSLLGCAGPSPVRTSDGRTWDPKLGVWSSPRLVGEGEAVPRGGGTYLTGRPYVIGGRSYYPSQNPTGYSAVGTASWYGDAFHGRRTANGEIFDKGSISAAHPTLPLPSYVRVTNLKNGRSIIVRVNDRGPYHGGRVMDVSQRVADALAFRGEGTARVRVEYLGRAGLDGGDDRKLLASLRTDGVPAQLDGVAPVNPVMLANTPQETGEGPAPPPVPRAETLFGNEPNPQARVGDPRGFVPLPPPRPFILGSIDQPVQRQARSERKDRLTAVLASALPPLSFAETGSAPRFPRLWDDVPTASPESRTP